MSPKAQQARIRAALQALRKAKSTEEFVDAIGDLQGGDLAKLSEEMERDQLARIEECKRHLAVVLQINRIAQLKHPKTLRSEAEVIRHHAAKGDVDAQTLLGVLEAGLHAPVRRVPQHWLELVNALVASFVENLRSAQPDGDAECSELLWQATVVMALSKLSTDELRKLGAGAQRH